MRTFALLALAAVAAAGCAGSRKAAMKDAATPLPPAAPATPPDLSKELEALKLEPALPLLEPLDCPLYAGDDRPDLAAKDLACVVGWLRAANEYKAHGGAPTKYTNEKQFAWFLKTAKELNARLGAHLAKEKWGVEPAPAAPAVAAAAQPAAPPAPQAPGPSAADSRASDQHYLSGIIFFQKGDYEQARREWKRAVELRPDNSDAQAGLHRIELIEGGR